MNLQRAAVRRVVAGNADERAGDGKRSKRIRAMGGGKIPPQQERAKAWQDDESSQPTTSSTPVEKEVVTAMIKIILGWLLVVFGILGAIAGIMTWFGGGGNGAWYKMIALGIGLAAVGWTLRGRR